MEQHWKLITEWNNLVPEKKLTATFAMIVIALTSVILYYESKMLRIEQNYKLELKEEKEEKNEILKKHIQYIEKSEREYRDIVLDIQNLKNK